MVAGASQCVKNGKTALNPFMNMFHNFPIMVKKVIHWTESTMMAIMNQGMFGGQLQRNKQTTGTESRWMIVSVEMHILKSHGDWLQARSGRIGGSDASAVVGMNPYKNNVELWMEKTGQIIPEDISDKPYVQYGTQAEMHLRGLFRLDFA